MTDETVSVPVSEETTPTPEEALKVLQEKQLKDEQECLKEVNASLEKYGFNLETRQVISLIPRPK